MVNSQYGCIMLKCTRRSNLYPKKIYSCTFLNCLNISMWCRHTSKPPLTFTFIRNSNQTMEVSSFACGASFPSLLFDDFAAFLAPIASSVCLLLFWDEVRSAKSPEPRLCMRYSVRRRSVLSRIQRWQLQALHQACLCILRPTNRPDCPGLLSGWAKHAFLCLTTFFESSFCHHLEERWCDVGFLQLESKYRNVLP